MNKLILSCSLLFVALACFHLRLGAQTTVYTNSFTGSGTTIPGGTPAATFTNLSGTRAGVQLGGTDISTLAPAFTANQLVEWVAGPATAPFLGTSTNNSFSQTTAPLAGYLTPFNSTLSLNPSLITWTFNMETQTAASGFANSNDNAVVVLAGTSATIRTAGNGYAVAFNPTTPQKIELIRYNGGLQGTVTTIINSSVNLASATNYASVRVTYDPGTNTWSLFVRDDGATAFANPATGVTASGGTAVDATYTGTAMSSFGFFSNHPAQTLNFILFDVSLDNYSYFDNYTVTENCTLPAITGTPAVCVGATTALSNSTAGGTWSSSTGSASIGALSGIATGVTAGTTVITYSLSGCTATVTLTVLPTPPAPLGTAEVCQGATTTLSDVVGPGTWASFNAGIATVGSATGVVSGVSAGTALLSYTVLSTGCQSSIIVTVDPLPSPIFGTLAVCEGLTTSLSNTVAGGLWASSNANSNIGPATGLASGVTAGTSVISYTAATCSPVTAVLTINPAPTAILGNLAICNGLTGSLSDALSGGTWLSGNAGVATIGSSSGLVATVSVGTTDITYTLPTGCKITAVLTVNQSPVAISGPSVVCEGLQTTLTDGTAGGTWSTSNGNTSIGSGTGVVSGITAGTSTITYTLPDGCTATAPFTVNPVPAAVSGLASGCSGLSINLSDATPGGLWTSSSPSVASVGSSSGVVTGGVPGMATITYQLPTTCLATIVVTVNPSPLAIVGSNTVCEGATTTLTDPAIGGTWASSAPGTAGIGSSSGILSGVLAGTATITYTLPIGGCTATMIITVNPIPLAINGPGSVCVGSSITLTDATTGGTWSSSAPPTSSVDPVTGIVTGISSGNISISYTIGTGCFVTAPVTVNPLPTVILGSSYVCNGLTTTLSDLTPGGTWSSSLPGIAGVGSGTGLVSGMAPGTAVISYTLPTGCYKTAPMTVNTPPTAIAGPATVCVASTVTLTNGTPGGTWSVAAGTISAAVGSSTGIVTGLALGTASVSYTTFSCNQVTYPITINPLPAPILGPGSVCAGSSASLSDLTPGGTWTASGATVSATGIVTGLTLGTPAVITYTLPTGCHQLASIAVSPVPGPINGLDTICPGTSVVLSDDSTGGVWSSSNGTVAQAIAMTGQINGLVPGNVTISYTFLSGCYTVVPVYLPTPLPASLSIIETPLDSFLCHNIPVTLLAHDSNAGAPTFEWKLFGSYVGSGSSFTYNPTHGDFITCIMTTHGVCAAPAVVAKDVTLNVWPVVAPIVELTCTQADTTAYLGEEYTFYTTVTNGGASPAYQWYINQVPVAGATGPVFTTRIYNDNDTIFCKVTGNSPCDSGTNIGISNTRIIHGQGYLQVGSISGGSGLTLFPNPNTGSFVLNGRVGADDEISLEVVDMLGRIVYTGKAASQSGELHAEIKLETEASGNYLLRVHSEAGNETFHFMVSK